MCGIRKSRIPRRRTVPGEIVEEFDRCSLRLWRALDGPQDVLQIRLDEFRAAGLRYIEALARAARQEMKRGAS